VTVAVTPVPTAAFAYAERGWHVFPVAGKVPLTERGFHDATDDLDAVERMFFDDRATGVGIACGASGLLVVDLDGLAAQEAWADLAASSGGHLPTLAAETGKPDGLHLYFTGEGRNTAGKLGPGVDTRGAGGYVVAPPSRHPSGRAYRFRDPDVDVVPAPTWLLAALEPPPPPPVGATRSVPPGENATPYGRAALEGLVDDVLRSAEGTRNDTLVRVSYRAGRLVAAGELTADAARVVLLEAARRVGLSATEADRTFRSGFDAGLELPAVRASR
jgi:hypothetical protein